jgi:diadenosine tetraphosphatase ApaH/serine/threonine PP2A family protein phosphatase
LRSLAAPIADADDHELTSIYAPLRAPCVAYGHIHRPFVRKLDGLTVANAGSVGLPWDGDPRAAYLLVDDGVPRTMRVEYDVEAEARALHEGGHPDTDRLTQTLRRGTYIPPQTTTPV